jgi:predicted ATPase
MPARPRARLKSLRLERFKNFEDATLTLGPFSVIVGANASGKSNIRDALRFLHGIARGYTLAEIIGEKWVEGGVLQWKGIRGGTREATFEGAKTFALEARLDWGDPGTEVQAVYRIEVDPGGAAQAPQVVSERLTVGDRDAIFAPLPGVVVTAGALAVNVGVGAPAVMTLPWTQPVLSQLLSSRSSPVQTARDLAERVVQALADVRFIDPALDALRMPSLPGQIVLGDRGENLSSVLQAICAEPQRRRALIEWLRELTPMDAADFEFAADQTGRILVTLVEQGGRRTSAHSASDGTLRFLALIAALLGPEPARFYFFEELENGVHPSRLHLLLALIEQRVRESDLQVVATSHSPQLLALLDEQSRQHASLVYRLPGSTAAQIRRIVDIPEVAEVLKRQDWARLHASGWLEDAVSLTAPDPEG